MLVPRSLPIIPKIIPHNLSSPSCVCVHRIYGVCVQIEVKETYKMSFVYFKKLFI